ncbi:hypothetical protein CLV24_1058 [Pontibacter ummariensis]|uniref:Uncharacterized protein n=1 Tax=Pontibacter ummariensis TaxID=1610492 RepID=A0A239E1R7_9BACT|nr:hypothetical protein [Pontibacter ummariensis]PRY13639.1 hypothetical protein CLV24_1058 [Pontibacter ummariensis]SNS38636.1 hypothetical protein SAMN06296052_105243 [Pontibacter ummariensis]
MKKYIYLIVSFAAFTFTACDPMEDVYEELDQLNPDVYAPELAIELASKDYELLKGKTGVPAYVAKDYYFKSEAEAAELIPQILNSKYPQFDNGTSVTVTYNELVQKFNENTTSGVVKYTVTEEDYDALGERYPNFNSAEDLINFLEYKYPSPQENQLVVLTYDYYASGSTSTLVGSFLYTNGEWVVAYHVTPENYDSVGNGRYDNFEAKDEESLPAYFNKFLSEKFLAAKTGEIKYVSYAYYSGRTSQEIYTMMYNGTKWVAVEATITVAKALQFAKQDGNWKPDLTVRYDLVAADYQWIAANPALGNESNRANLASYGNFYQSSTTSSNYWSPEAVLKALGALLKNKYPAAEEGQKFQLTYAAYKGGNIAVTVTLILENGEYVEYKK